MRKHVIFGVSVLALLMGSMTTTAIAVAFPQMVSDLKTSLVWAGWVLTVYQLVFIATMPLAGKASDAFGRKRVFLACVVLYSIGSIASTFAPTIHLLIAARIVQAVGGSGLLPSAVGIVNDAYPQSRTRAIGFISSIPPIGQIIGPNLGGFLVGWFGWRSVFWIPVPLALALLIVALLVFPRDKKGGSVHWDMISTALLIGGLTAILLSLGQLGEGISTEPVLRAAAFAAAGVLSLVLFIRRESRSADPVIEIALLRERPFAAANTYNFVFGAGVQGIVNLMPLYAVSVYGMSTIASGIVLTPRSIATIVAAAGTSMLLKRFGYRIPMLAGTIAMCISLLILAIEVNQLNIAGFSIDGIGLMLVAMFIAGLGAGMSNPASNNACVELKPDKVASIIGLRGMFRYAGGAFFISIATFMLHFSGSLNSGFTIVFLTLTAALMLAIPLIYLMPDGFRGVKQLKAR